MPKETNQYLASNHVSVNVKRRRSHGEGAHPIAPSPAFKRVRVGSNEVDYVAEDVTIRHFINRSAGKQVRSGARTKSLGTDVTIRYFSKASMILSQSTSESSAAQASNHPLPTLR